MNLLSKLFALYRGIWYNIIHLYSEIVMPRPRSETPKEHTSIIRAKRKDGWTYVQRVTRNINKKIE